MMRIIIVWRINKARVAANKAADGGLVQMVVMVVADKNIVNRRQFAPL